MADYDVIIRGARVIDPARAVDEVTAIAVKDGAVVGVPDDADASADEIIDATGMVASPGWIDLHTHVYDGAVMSGGVDADRDAGIAAGVTTVVDAGSSGAGTWDALRSYVLDRSTTRVLAFMNVSLMPARGPRHGDWQNFSQGKSIRLAEAEAAAGRCLGIKVLASQTHCGNLELAPVKLARQAARLSGTGLMVHIGNAPPVIEDVLELLGPGDIVTHCWHGKYGGLLGRNRKPLPEAWAAVERGVKFDLGHGSASFSFDTARRALDAGLPLHAISTDLHGGNVNGPVYDMATTMTKLLHLGMSLPDVIRMSTQSPAALIHRDHELGSLAPGREADITLFRVIEDDFEVMDSEGRTEHAARRIQAASTIRAGKVMQEPAHAG
jgi:dihydroorotase